MWCGVLILSAAVSLAGCVAAGTKVDPGVVSSFKAGEATYADVIGRLGAPNHEVAAGNGWRVIVYSYTQASARPETFIPIVGPLVGGADATSQAVVMRFSPAGVLEDVTTSSSRTGAAYGAPAVTRASQPTSVP